MIDFVMSLVRHLLTTGGGYLTANGIASASETEAIIGGVTALIGLGLSWWDKRQKAKELAAAKAAPAE